MSAPAARPPGAAFVRSQDADPHAVGMDYAIFKKSPLDVSMVTAPVFTYYGARDTTVPYSQRDARVDACSSSSRIKQRNCPDGVHDVQYRRWDQILLDVAGHDDNLVVADNGRTKVIPESRWPKYEARGAILDMQAWVTARPPSTEANLRPDRPSQRLGLRYPRGYRDPSLPHGVTPCRWMRG